MFGAEKRRRREAEQAAAAEAVRQAEFEKFCAEAYETGRTGTVEALRQANERLKGSSWSGLNKLREGVVAAFREGNPENFRAMLSAPEEFLLQGGEADSIGKAGLVTKMLFQVAQDSDNPVDALTRALAGFAQQKKQELLDGVLYSHTGSGRKRNEWNDKTLDKNDEAFIDALLQAGANANAYDGRIFAVAIAMYSPAVVKTLRAGGGEYKDALLIMNIEQWEGQDGYYSYFKGALKNLQSYQEYENGGVMEQLQENIRDLTARLEDAEARLDELQPGRKVAVPTPVPEPSTSPRRTLPPRI